MNQTIAFQELPPSPAVEASVRTHVAKLAKFYGRLEACRGFLSTAHRRHRTGTRFRVRVELDVPGERLVVGRERGRDGAHEDVYVAVRDAFRAARRPPEDHARRIRGA